MGGFSLVGPNYVIQSKPEHQQCRCLGFSGVINAEYENRLIKNRVLDEEHAKFLIKVGLIKKPEHGFGSMHFGDNMEYTFRKRNKEQEKKVEVKDEKKSFNRTPMQGLAARYNVHRFKYGV